MAGRIRRSSSYTTDEVALIMMASPESVRRWIRSGELRAYFTHRGTGGGYRITHGNLAAFVKTKYPYLTLDIPD